MAPLRKAWPWEFGSTWLMGYENGGQLSTESAYPGPGAALCGCRDSVISVPFPVLFWLCSPHTFSTFLAKSISRPPAMEDPAPHASRCLIPFRGYISSLCSTGSHAVFPEDRPRISLQLRMVHSQSHLSYCDGSASAISCIETKEDPRFISALCKAVLTLPPILTTVSSRSPVSHFLRTAVPGRYL